MRKLLLFTMIATLVATTGCQSRRCGSCYQGPSWGFFSRSCVTCQGVPCTKCASEPSQIHVGLPAPSATFSTVPVSTVEQPKVETVEPALIPESSSTHSHKDGSLHLVPSPYYSESTSIIESSRRPQPVASVAAAPDPSPQDATRVEKLEVAAAPPLAIAPELAPQPAATPKVAKAPQALPTTMEPTLENQPGMLQPNVDPSLSNNLVPIDDLPTISSAPNDRPSTSDAFAAQPVSSNVAPSPVPVQPELVSDSTPQEIREVVEPTTPWRLKARQDMSQSEVEPGSVGTRILLNTFDAAKEPAVDAKYGLPVGDDVDFEPLPPMNDLPEASSIDQTETNTNEAMLVVYRDPDGTLYLAPPTSNTPDDSKRIGTLSPIQPKPAKMEYYQPPLTMLRLKATTPVNHPKSQPNQGSITFRDTRYFEGTHLLRQEPLESNQRTSIADQRVATEPSRSYMLQSTVERLMPRKERR